MLLSDKLRPAFSLFLQVREAAYPCDGDCYCYSICVSRHRWVISLLSTSMGSRVQPGLCTPGSGAWYPVFPGGLLHIMSIDGYSDRCYPERGCCGVGQGVVVVLVGSQMVM